MLLLGIGLGAAVGLLRGAVLAWLPVGVALGLCLRGGAGTRSGSGKDSLGILCRRGCVCRGWKRK